MSGLCEGKMLPSPLLGLCTKILIFPSKTGSVASWMQGTRAWREEEAILPESDMSLEICSDQSRWEGPTQGCVPAGALGSLEVA